MSVWDLVLAALLALLGGYLAVSALRAWPLIVRLKRPLSRIAHLVPGGANVSGELRAASPVTAFDGSPAVLYRRTLRCRKALDEESVTVVVATLTECAEAEVCDASGACPVRLDHLLLLAPVQRHELTGDEIAARHPRLLAEVFGLATDVVVEKLVVDETAIPDGAPCFISGLATPGDAEAQHRATRSGRARELRGEPDHPLVISCWDQATVVHHMRSPVLGLAWLALLAVFLAGIAIAVPLWMVRW